MVRFGLERSAASHHVLGFLFECCDLLKTEMSKAAPNNVASNTNDQKANQIKLLSTWLGMAFSKMDKFVVECLEFFWLLSLSVPRITVDVTFAKETHNTHYKRHILIPPVLRKTINSESVAYPPLVNANDNSLLLHGICM